MLVVVLHAWENICQGVTSCVHERGRNQISPFWTQVMFSVFRGPKYDDIGPNHTKKYQKWYTIDALGAIFVIVKSLHFCHF